MRLLSEYHGSHYADEEPTRHYPINMMQFTATLWMRNLVPQNSRVKFTTKFPRVKADADNLTLAYNDFCRQINFNDLMEEVVLDSLNSWGVAVIGHEAHQQALIEGEWIDDTMPYMASVDLDDWVHDPFAESVRFCRLMGHRWRVPLEWAKANKAWNSRVRNKLQARERADLNEEGDERPETLSYDTTPWNEEFQETVEVWNIYLPGSNSIVVVPDGLWDDILEEIDHDGPRDTKPYHFLHYHRVPKNLLPIPPLGIIRFLNRLANVLFVKMTDQALDQKTVIAANQMALDDAKKITDAKDREVIPVADVNALREIVFAGSDPSTANILVMVRNFLSEMGGNIDLMSGLGPQSPTLGQDQILANNSSSMMQFMGGKVVNFVAEVAKHIGWELWNAPLYDPGLTKEIPGTDMGQGPVTIPADFHPLSRTADWIRFDCEAEPYSFQPQTPQEKLRTIMTVTAQLIIPLADRLEAAGRPVSIPNLIDLIADLSNTPELKEIVQEGAGQMARGPEPRGDEPRKPSVTHRFNTRTSQPAMTPMANRNRLVNAMNQGGNQNRGAGALGAMLGAV